MQGTLAPLDRQALLELGLDPASTIASVAQTRLAVAEILPDTRQVHLRFEGGHGWWQDRTTASIVTVAQVESVGLSLWLPQVAVDLWAWYADRLELWRLTGQPVTLTYTADLGIVRDEDGYALQLPPLSVADAGGELPTAELAGA